jgi:hypothetical protein
MSKRDEFTLTDKERKYLKTGDSSSYSEKEMQRRIRNKREKLAPRLQTLIDDVTLMYVCEFFDEDSAHDDWKKIRNLDHTLNVQSERFISRLGLSPNSDELFMQVEETQTVAEFGHLIGGLFHMLMTAAPNERPWEDLLRGIVTYYVAMLDGHAVPRLNKLNEITRFRSIEKIPAPNKPDNLEDSNESRSTADAIIRDREYENSDYKYNVFEETVPLIVEELTWEILEINDFIPNRELATGILINTDPTLDYEPEAKRELQRLIEDTPLKEIDHINRAIQKDIDVLTKEWRGPDRDKIVKTLFWADNKLTSREIASEVDRAIVDNLVTTALNKMSEESDSSNSLTEYHLFEHDNDEWKLTPYGKLCARYLIEEDAEDSLYRYVVDIESDKEYKQLIPKVVDQIKSDKE